MPLYAYTTKAGVTVERFFAMGEAPPKVRAQGKVAYRNYSAESKRGFLPGNWPMVSNAVGVAPEQAKEAQEDSVRIGIPTEFTRDGDPVFTSPHHRKRYCEAYGFYDRNAGVNDPLPRERT